MRLKLRVFGGSLLAIILVGMFQNCTHVTNHSSQTAKQKGGTGTDGMVYANYSLCASGIVDIANKVLVSGDTAQVIRQDCADLAQPVFLATSQLQFDSADQNVLQLNGKNYDRQTGTVVQPITVQLCRSTTDSTQVRIWKYFNSTSGLFGQIVQDSGSGSEPLLLDPAASGPINYRALPTQPSQFSLTTSNGTGSVNFSIDGAPSTVIATMVCGTQALPTMGNPASLPPPVGYTASLLTFEDTFSMTNLDSTKWIPQIADQNGIWRKSVPAPYSASDAGGYNAEFFDPLHVTTGKGLGLVATRDTTFPGYTWRSGVVSTHGLFTFASGYVQIKARFPDSSTGMWAAINFFQGGANFGFASGFLGGAYPNQNVQTMVQSAGNSQVVYNAGTDLSADYHVYGMEYRPGTSIKMYVDGVQIANYTSNIPTGAYEIVLNLSVAQNAGTWHTLTNGVTPSPSEYDVSDVQVFNLPP